MKEKITCAFCGEVLNEDTAYTFAGKTMCKNCYDENTVTCDNCEKRIWRDDAEGDSHYTLCQNCYDYSYTTCEECGRLIHNDDALYEDGGDYPYCRDCFDKLNDEAIILPSAAIFNYNTYFILR